MGGEEHGELMPGAMLTPSLRLVRPLGAGGMGRVWIADHLGLRTQVAVKLISADLANDPDALDRFSREAAAAARVKSPHVVSVLDFGVTDASTTTGIPFIAMELLDGRDLAHWIHDHGALDPTDVATIVQHVARALSKAHEHGIVHRDIKPENVFLVDAGGGTLFAKVLDFGVAKAPLDTVSRATGTGAVIGTPHYMSPEQIRGEKTLDARSDVFSLGVTAFHALTGEVPFAGETIGAIAISICHDALPRPSAIRPSIGWNVDRWFARACARDPTLRFQSAMELAIGLERAIAADVLRAQSEENDEAFEDTLIVEPMDIVSPSSAEVSTPRLARTSTAEVEGGDETTVSRPAVIEPLTPSSRIAPSTLSVAPTLRHEPRVTTGGASSVVTSTPTGRPVAMRTWRQVAAIGGVVALLAIVAVVAGVARTGSETASDDGETHRRRQRAPTRDADDLDETATPASVPAVGTSASMSASSNAGDAAVIPSLPSSSSSGGAPSAAPSHRDLSPRATATSTTSAPRPGASSKRKKGGYVLE